MDSVVATINVTTPGVHTINVWMREDGMIFDKLVLTTNSGYIPTGTGPVESTRNPIVSIPFTDTFDSINGNWVTVDQTNKPSNWVVASGEYQQQNRVESAASIVESYHLGTYSYFEPGVGLTNYKFSVTARPEALSLNDDIGVMFRYQDPQNYYRYSLNARMGTSRLEKIVGGVFTPLATDSRGYIKGQTLNITVEADGDKIFVYLNGDPVFAVSDSSLTAGTIALYAQEKAIFDNVSIDPADTSPIIAISTPLAYLVNTTTTLNVSAVTLNEPVNAYVEFLLDGISQGTDNTPPYAIQLTGVAIGNHTVKAILHDSSGSPLSQDTNVLVGAGGDQYIGVGDSITNGIGDYYAGDNILGSGLIIGSNGYEANLTDLLNTSLSYPDIVLNEGIGGDESADAAFIRINSILARHPDANKVLILLGTNDANTSIPSGLGCTGTACNGTYKGNMQALIDTITAAGKQAWVALVPPAFGSGGTPFADPATAPINTSYVQVYNQVTTTELSNINIGPDFYSFFLGGGTNLFSLFNDLLHPNALGYTVMAALWHNSLNPAGAIPLPFILGNLSPSTTAPYVKQDLIEAGDNYYVDEAYTVIDPLPAQLNNGIWIKTANADKSNSNISYVSFDLDRSATVYVAYDAGATTLPDWLSGYTDTGLTIATTDPLTPNLRLYSMAFVGPTSVTLGGNLQGSAAGADSNYVAIVVKN